MAQHNSVLQFVVRCRALLFMVEVEFLVIPPAVIGPHSIVALVTHDIAVIAQRLKQINQRVRERKSPTSKRSGFFASSV